MQRNQPIHLENRSFLNSMIAPGIEVGSKTLVDCSNLGEGWKIGQDCLICGVSENVQPFGLPNSTVLQQVGLIL